MSAIQSLEHLQDTTNMFSNITQYDWNFTVVEADVTTPLELMGLILICIVLFILIIATIVGNVFVMVAIVKDKSLNNLSNYLVFSLALADLLVALLVMPLGAVYEINREWTLGPELCDLWTSCDVLCCTASILHLLAIAVDRYWAVTNIDYARNRSKWRIYLAIVLVWVTAFAVSIAPVIGWKDPEFNYRIEVERRCLISQDLGFQIFATASSFYVPLVLILILYYSILKEARKRIRRRPGAASKAMLLIQRPPPPVVEQSCCSSTIERPASTVVLDTTTNSNETTITTVNSNGMSTTSTSNCGSTLTTPKTSFATASKTVVRLLHLKKREKKQDNLAKREKKAAKTLAIITGVFVICWLPFFVIALVLAICPIQCMPNSVILSLFLWLGYANSMLNPIIYTIFSPDFRSAFRKLLCLSSRQSSRASI